MKINVPPSFVAPKNWMKWEKMEIARTPIGEEGGTAWRGVAWRTVPTSKNGTTQRYVRGPFVRLAILLFAYPSMKVMKQGTSFPVFVFLWLQSLWMNRT